MPCSHLIHVYLIHAIDEESPNRMPYQFSSRAVVNTWASRFEPYLDPTQWPSYDGEEFVADPNLKIKTRGKRRSKRFKNEMDSGLGGSGRKPPSCVQLDAAPVQNRCSLCHQEGHKKTKCPKRPKKKKSKKNLSVREVNILFSYSCSRIHFLLIYVTLVTNGEFITFSCRMAEEGQPPTYPALEAYYEARHRGAAIEAGRV